MGNYTHRFKDKKTARDTLRELECAADLEGDMVFVYPVDEHGNQCGPVIGNLDGRELTLYEDSLKRIEVQSALMELRTA